MLTALLHRTTLPLALPAGKRLYGVQNRPACRVLRYAADAATAAANAASDERQAARPAGRRHDAFLLYLEGLRRNEQEWGLKGMRGTSVSSQQGGAGQMV